MVRQCGGRSDCSGGTKRSRRGDICGRRVSADVTVPTQPWRVRLRFWGFTWQSHRRNPEDMDGSDCGEDLVQVRGLADLERNNALNDMKVQAKGLHYMGVGGGDTGRRVSRQLQCDSQGDPAWSTCFMRRSASVGADTGSERFGGRLGAQAATHIARSQAVRDGGADSGLDRRAGC
jgi:hypothetical protein